MSALNTALEKALVIIKAFEGCRLNAYQCPAGVWTIGYGETLDVRQGDVWTQEQAENMIKKRVAQFMSLTLKKCPQLSEEPPRRLAACTSLAYNIGTGAFGSSSVCRLTGRKEYDRAADSFLLWNKAGGRVLRGLTLRRQAERSMYLGE